jgi:transmembrane sensor
LLQIGTPGQVRKAQRELEAWLRATPDSQRILERAQAAWHQVDALSPMLQAEPLQRRRTARRRNIVLGALAALGASALAMRWRLADPMPWDLDEVHATATSEQKALTLPDGVPASQLIVAPLSQVRVQLAAHLRRIELERGEAWFGVKAQANRPFHVASAFGEVHVVGTAFQVSVRHARLQVAVEQGVVEVLARAGEGGGLQSPVRVAAGQSFDAPADGHVGKVRTIDPRDVAAWRSGWQVFDGAPVHEVIHVLNAYRPAPISLAPEANRRLQTTAITGRVQAFDDAALAAMFARHAGLRWDRQTNGAVILR